MLTKQELEQYLQKCLSSGADFAEIFLEKKEITSIIMGNEKIEQVITTIEKGIGIRIAKNTEKVYGYTNKLEKSNIMSLIDKLILPFDGKRIQEKIVLEPLKKYEDKIEISHQDFSTNSKKELLMKLNQLARKESSKVNQVEAKISEEDQLVTIVNSDGVYKQDKRIATGLVATVYVKEGEKQEKSSVRKYYKQGYEGFKNLDIEKESKKLASSALKKLQAIECPSGKMPVIIGNGFGGVIFHEACGHSLEATTVAKGTSSFCNLLNKKVANAKVTLKDNAIIPFTYGSNNIDDEGNICQENTLIDKGILKSYLIDNLNNRLMHQKPTASGRRQSYKYSPTSRMSNTYLEKGSDKLEEMIASIPFGIYAKDMGGGSVNPMTGDFNFSVNDAYLIEDGKITVPVKGASLIGNGKDVINQVSMVSDDLSLSPGWCGSISGSIPVTVGCPTIKVDNILVGGKGEKVHEL